MRPSLTPTQQRVIGVMLEKSLCQPDYYPMTLNAITAACNQKQNRWPVLSVSEREVARAIHELQEMRLVTLAPPEPGARANRFRHEAQSQLRWDRPQQAVMAELLCRGPQTAGELRSRAGRMATFQTLEVVNNVLQYLACLDPPLVVRMEREPGKSADRYAHLLCPEDQVPAPATGASPAIPTNGATLPSEWTHRIEELERKLTELTEKVARIEAKVISRFP